jgi:opacity protein-like surface antigen
VKKIVFFVFLAMPLILNGQRFNGGIVAGFSATQVDGDSYAGYDKVGLQGGVFVNTQFTEMFGAQMEIKYVSKGASKVQDKIELYRLALHYIDIPVFLTLTFKEKFIAEGGLVPGYLFRSAGDVLSGPGITEGFKNFDLAWMLGFRYAFSERLSFGARYSYSLIPIRSYTNVNSNYGIIANLFGYNTGDYNNYLTFGAYFTFF